jgi:hypothetical protein
MRQVLVRHPWFSMDAGRSGYGPEIEGSRVPRDFRR